MSRLSVVVFACALVLLCAVHTEAAPPLNRVPRTFNISLDQPPEERWNQAVVAVVEDFGWEGTYGAVMEYMTDLVPAWAIKLLAPLVAKMTADMGEYGQEIQGLYNALKPYAPKDSVFSVGAVVAMNLIYSFSAACTSIVAQNTNGTIYHGRNLDYPIPGLRNLTAEVVFTRGDNVEYYGTTFLGYVGLLTGMRPHGWSVSVDERSQHYANILDGPLDNIMSALEGGKPVGMFLRDSLQNITSYDAAIKHLNTTRLIAPVYLIVAGTESGQGAVITRNRTHADDSRGIQNGVWELDLPAGNWWRLETNYDHWNPPPKDDDRRDPANNAMAAIGQSNINADTLFDKVLSLPPVLNDDTKYTTIMSADLDLYHVVVRDYTGPREEE